VITSTLEDLDDGPAPESGRCTAPVRNDTDKPFTRANAIDTTEVLTWLGIETETKGGKTFCTCPGCGEPGALVTDAGVKCLHDRCSNVGPQGFAGLRSNVDLVCAVRGAQPKEAVNLLAERFGVEGFSNRATPRATGAQNDNEPKRFQLLEPASIWAPLEPPVYTIGGIIREASINEIAAYGGSAKTWLGVDAVVSVAAGVPWLGRFQTRQGRAAFLDYESGNYEIRRRFQAVTKARGLGQVDGIDIACLPDLYLDSLGFVPAVTELAQGRALIVIDTLRAGLVSQDENDSGIRVYLDNLRRISESTRCAFLVLVHSKKTPVAGGVDAREMGRGSSAIHDAADTVLYLEWREAKPQRVRQTKARFGRIIDPFDVTVTDTDNGGVLVAAHDVADEPTESFDAKAREVLAIVEANPGASSRLVCERAGMRTQRTLACLESLALAGRIENQGTDKAAKWHSATPAPHWTD
jgi:hypothetical protein